MDPLVQDKIQDQVRSTPLMVYMKGTPAMPMCGFSSSVVRVLDQMGVTYESVNVLEDPEIRQGIKEYSNWPTIPQVYLNGEFIGGCDIIIEMFERGELQTLLQSSLGETSQS